MTPASPAFDDAFGAVRPGQAATTAVTYFDRDRVSGYSHQFNLTVERQLPGSIILAASILGNLGRKLSSADLSINQISPQIVGPAHRSQGDRLVHGLAGRLVGGWSIGELTSVQTGAALDRHDLHLAGG